MNLHINDIFYSLQGETLYTGLPSLFIRLQGCNLRCSFCDTSHSQSTDGGTIMTISEIIDKVNTFNTFHHITITGGEPLIQNNVLYLLELLVNQNHRVQIETNGSISLKDIPPSVRKIVDIKPPSSGEEKSFYIENILYMTENDEYKCIISNNNDYEFALNFIKKHLSLTSSIINFSPVESGEMPPKKLAQLIINDRLQVRLNLQIHKLLNFD